MCGLPGTRALQPHMEYVLSGPWILKNDLSVCTLWGSVGGFRFQNSYLFIVLGIRNPLGLRSSQRFDGTCLGQSGVHQSMLSE